VSARPYRLGQRQASVELTRSRILAAARHATAKCAESALVVSYRMNVRAAATARTANTAVTIHGSQRSECGTGWNTVNLSFSERVQNRPDGTKRIEGVQVRFG
jgi:hypothetical protein